MKNIGRLFQRRRNGQQRSTSHRLWRSPPVTASPARVPALRPVHNAALVTCKVGIRAGFGGLREVRAGARKRNLAQRIWLQSAHQAEVEVAPAGRSGPGPRRENPTHLQASVLPDPNIFWQPESLSSASALQRGCPGTLGGRGGGRASPSGVHPGQVAPCSPG